MVRKIVAFLLLALNRRHGIDQTINSGRGVLSCELRQAGVNAGSLSWEQNVNEYRATALKKMPDLQFELKEVTTSVNSNALCYKSVMDTMAIEVMFFDDQGIVNKVIGHYTNQRHSADSCE